MYRKISLLFSLSTLVVISADAQITTWKLGGDGLQWVSNDTAQVMVDFESVPGAIQPVYIQPGQNIIQLAENWCFRPAAGELHFARGEFPRVWK